MTTDLSKRWATASLPEPDRGGAWLDTIEQVYGPCDLSHPVPLGYDATLDFRAVDKFSVIDLTCDPIRGRRVPAKPQPERFRSFSVQLIESGEKAFSSNGQTVLARPGDVLINMAPPRTDFEVRERSHEITISMPLSRLRTWLPNSWRLMRHRLSAGSAGALLLTSNFKAVSTAFLSGSLNNGLVLSEAMIGLVVAVIGEADSSATVRNSQLAQIKAYIDAHLDDPNLGPTLIASAKRMSVRYLHTLFEPESMTLQQYIIRERLLRCRRDIQNPCMRNRTITEIAYGCGFQNSAHFSRRFKEAFGMSPSELRAGAGRHLAA